MQWPMIVLIALASSVDNLAVGLSYAVRGKQFTSGANLIIAGIGFVASLIALTAGRLIGGFMPPHMAGHFGGALILLIGIWSLGETYRHRRHTSKTFPEADTVDKDRNNLITPGEIIWLGCALAFNAVGTSLGAGIGGRSPLPVAILIGGLSYLSIAAGQRIGLNSPRSGGTWSEIAAALLLIAVGLWSIVAG
ncbi:MAG: manganese efflux pump [Sporolactobacillus sp.]|jgi:putative sporulation protein YtaF|nr:manganese efflux pump [Sporolactobacillus sp.]